MTEGQTNRVRGQTTFFSKNVKNSKSCQKLPKIAKFVITPSRDRVFLNLPDPNRGEKSCRAEQKITKKAENLFKSQLWI